MSETALGNSTSSKRPIILVVDGDPDARQIVRGALSGNYRLLEASSAAVGLAQIKRIRPALIVTEFDLPDMDLIKMIRHIRARTSLSPVVVVSARSDQESIINALDGGADDFIVKPFSMGELGARIRVALRHSTLNPNAISDKTFRFGELEVDLDRRNVRVSGTDVHLTPIEYRILSVLIVNSDRVLTYSHLLRKVWEPRKHREIHHLRVHMASLRKKLASSRTRLHHLVTKPGVGYQFHSGGR